MWVKLTHRNTGLPALTCFSMKSAERAAMSSSIVSIRFLVSGPVSSIVCVPTGRSAKLWITPRGPKFLRKLGNSGSLGFGIIRQFRLFLGVEVIEIAVELVEAVDGRQNLVLVAKVVLAELAGGVALRLEQFGDGRVFLLQPESAPGNPTLVRPVRKHALAGDEGRTSGGAALLAVIIGENHRRPWRCESILGVR